jgi:hypothetical protein
MVTEKAVQYSYAGEVLGITELGKNISVIIDPNDKSRAYAYLKFTKGFYDERVRSEEDVCYLGELWDTTIRVAEDFDRKGNRYKLQLAIEDQANKLTESIKDVESTMLNYAVSENRLLEARPEVPQLEPSTPSGADLKKEKTKQKTKEAQLPYGEVNSPSGLSFDEAQLSSSGVNPSLELSFDDFNYFD